MTTSQISYTDSGMPFVVPAVFGTNGGTSYLKSPGVALVAAPSVDLGGVRGFLDGFDAELGFSDYLDDPTDLPPAEALVKFMGRAGPGTGTPTGISGICAARATGR